MMDWTRLQVEALLANFQKDQETRLRQFTEEIMMLVANSHEKGMRWQSEFCCAARERDLVVEPGPNRADYLVNGLLVQCKWIDQIDEAGVVAIENMRPVKANGGERGYRVGEYDVMALKHRGQVYLIPAAELTDGKRLASRIKVAMFVHCRDRWDLFADQPPPVPWIQLGLLD